MRKWLLLLGTISLVSAACPEGSYEKDVRLNITEIFAKLDAEKEKKFTPLANFDKKNNQFTYGAIKEESYYSNTTQAARKCNVYTPPNYDSAKTYPVLYLLHGIGGIHTEWMNGNPNEVLSNLINMEKAKPMIVVMPNVRAKQDDSVSGNIMSEDNVAAFHNFINDLRDDLMPFIKANYSVSHKRHETAVAGLSMGGMTAIQVGLMMPETFGYIGAFSSAPTLPQYDYGRDTGDFSQMDIPPKYKNNTFILICCGSGDYLVSHSRNYNQALVNNGVSTYYYEIPGIHDFVFWKNGLYFFAQCIF